MHYSVIVGAIAKFASIEMVRRFAAQHGGDSGANDALHCVLVVDAGCECRTVTVNVQSRDCSQLLHRHIEDFRSPIIEKLRELSPGVHRLTSRPESLAFDYVRGGYLKRDEMDPIDAESLQEKMERWTAEKTALRIYPVGELVPKITLGMRGMHNVHMNQGHRDGYYEKNGVWQDGGLFVSRKKAGTVDRFEALFLAFQGQSWDTDAAGCPRS